MIPVMKCRAVFAWAAVIAVCCVLACGTAAIAQQTPPDPGSSDAASSPTNGDGRAAADQTSQQVELSSFFRSLKVTQLWWANWPIGWASLLLAVFLGLVAGRIAAAVLERSARRFEARQWVIWEHVVEDSIGPAKLALFTLALSLGVGNLAGMAPPLQQFWVKTLLLLYSIAVFWYAFNLVSVVDVLLRRVTARTESTLDDQIVPLIRKTLRVFVVIIAVMFVVDSVFERDITALLAGVSVAGLAVTLAAQDSLKNLFGSITILFDQPFRIGERIVYAGYDGMVEEIGFRSTKVRTLTGHVVTIPNSKIVNDPVENIGRRPSIRRVLNVTITYDTPREKIERGVQILRDILEEEGIREPIHPVIQGDEYPPRVYFNDYNPDSLNLFVIYWFAPPAYWDYLEHAQRLNLRIFEEFEKAGIEFAFPTQTLYVAGDPKRQLALKMLGRDL
jgi:small-conductance mechanosensitive channel